MATTKIGDKIKINYIGTFEDDTIFNSSFHEKPLEITIGAGSVIAGFDEALAGMEVGGKKNIILEPEKAYGEHKKELVLEIDRGIIPEGIEPELRTILPLRVSEDKVLNVAITNIEGDKITVDGNHPLAGKRLIFDIILLEIVESS